jgi:hypothetical protein
MINYYQCVTSSSNVLGSIEIQDYLNKIKQGDENLGNIEEARNYYNDDDAKYAHIKRNLLPCYSLNFTFNQFRRNTNTIDSTGYIYIDIDGSININFSNPLLYASWISLSGQGRGALVKVNNLNSDNFSFNYELISKELGVESDNGAKKLSQLNVLSYDPNIHINKDSITWEAKYLSSDKVKKTHYSGKIKSNPIIDNVLGSFIEPIIYDNLNELIENVEFNGNVIYDYVTKVDYSRVKIPWNGIPIGKRNSILTGLAYQFRAFNQNIEKLHLFRFINKVNREKCYEPLPVSEVDAIVESIMKIEDILPIENATRRFVFNPDYDLTIAEKRQEVMKVLNSDRIQNSKLKIESAIEDWDFVIDGKITQNGIAIKTFMNIKTVKKYYPLYKTDIQMLNKKYTNNNN